MPMLRKELSAAMLIGYQRSSYAHFSHPVRPQSARCRQISYQMRYQDVHALSQMLVSPDSAISAYVRWPLITG